MASSSKNDVLNAAVEALCPTCGHVPAVNEVRLDDPRAQETRRSAYCYTHLKGNDLKVTGSNYEEVQAVAAALAKDTQGYIGVGEHLNSAKGLLYLIVGGALFAAICFIIAGLTLVYLGATGASTVDLFGATIKSESAGIVSIFFGAVTLILIFRQAMHKIEAILRIQRGANDR